MNLIKGDIHKIIKTLKDNTFDLLYTNPPFSMTNASWDKELIWNELWKDIWRVLKPNGVVVLHSTQRFTIRLCASQIKYFKYKWIWKKNNITNFFHAKKQPLRVCEDICVFYKKTGTYNPQMIGSEFHKKRLVKYGGNQEYYGKDKKHKDNWGTETTKGGHKGRYPKDILTFNIKKSKKNENDASTRPIELVEYIIKTYSNENDNVLDITCYDAITGKVCEKLNRQYTGIDLNLKIN